MGLVTLNAFGVDEIRQQLVLSFLAFSGSADQAVQASGLACQKYAKQACPVNTGRLRSSIQYKNTGLFSCIVGTTVKYGLFVELGHKTRGGHGYVAPRPYLRPAFETSRVELITNLKALRM